MVQVRGRWAVITGASSGLGVDFAKTLAARGMNLVLVARRQERLEALAGQLRARHGVEVDVVAIDLSQADAPSRLHEETQRRAREVLVLVNNAGFGLYGSALELDPKRVREMLMVDVACLTELAMLYGRGMQQRGAGYILNVGSIAGMQPSPNFAAYAAAKAYVVSYSYALREELRKSGVAVTVLAPGATATEFFEASGSQETLYIRLLKMPAQAVIDAGLRGLFARRALVVPGLLNKLQVWGAALLPTSLVARIVTLVMRPTSPSLPSGDPPRLPG